MKDTAFIPINKSISRCELFSSLTTTLRFDQIFLLGAKFLHVVNGRLHKNHNNKTETKKKTFMRFHKRRRLFSFCSKFKHVFFSDFVSNESEKRTKFIAVFGNIVFCFARAHALKQMHQMFELNAQISLEIPSHIELADV